MKPELLKHLFSTQAARLHLEQDGAGRVLRYLTSSADYWGLSARAPERQMPDRFLLVVWRHTSCVPLPVFALEEGRLYAPYNLPYSFPSLLEVKLTKKTSRVFLGALLAGVQDAYVRLQQMPRATRARYLRKLQATAAHRGRPRVAA
ncbi:MAG: hypothetical protein IRZ03_16225 [Acidobacterium ailaaui]|nr:hypothetical protein [Pseudacidobacterium ailaaui]